MPASRGFSLVECVVAATLCAAGVLALAGSSRALLDLALLGHRTAGGAQVAEARLATLRLSACAAGGEGTTGDATYEERWSVAGAGPIRQMVVEVVFAVGARAHFLRYERVITCPD